MQKTENKEMSTRKETIPTESSKRTMLGFFDFHKDIYEWVETNARSEGIDEAQVVADIVSEAYEKRNRLTEFENIQREQVTLALPKPIVDYYRCIAQVQKKPVGVLMAYDLVDNLDAEFEGRNSESWKDLFGVGSAINAVINEE